MKKPYEEMKVTLVGTVSNVVNKWGPRHHTHLKSSVQRVPTREDRRSMT